MGGLPMDKLDEARTSFQNLSPAAAQFLDYLLDNTDRIEQLTHFADDLPPWTRTYPTTQLTWPAFVGAQKLQEIQRAVEKVCGLVKSLPERIFENDAKRISDFYNYGDASLVELLLEPPNGVEGAVARCDFIDGAEGFKCCEINMAPNVGGWESRFWEQKYLKNETVSSFLAEHKLRASHHDPLRTFCLHMADDALTSGVCSDGTLNVAVVCGDKSIPGEAGKREAQRIYDDFLRVANREVKGCVLFCSARDLSVKSGYLYHGDQRAHAVVNYAGTVLPKQVYWSHKAGTICLYNGPLTKMMSDKRNLALLSQFEHSDIFDDEEQKIIQDHVPWSRIVVEGKTTYRGETVTFPDFLIAAKDRLVLKLGIGLGGKEVHVGNFTAEPEWRPLIEQALKDGGWMVQEYVDGRPYLFADGEGNIKPQNVVWGMFCFGNRYGGGYLRMLPKGVRSGIVNSGGGAVEAPIFEIQTGFGATV
ncbi:MAG TPA: hypothetical protein VEV42_10145 [Pyrinomonadaceae bacterium]|nr:hypothetical protein [Pyrinomonadaceae bacterium]